MASASGDYVWELQTDLGLWHFDVKPTKLECQQRAGGDDNYTLRRVRATVGQQVDPVRR